MDKFSKGIGIWQIISSNIITDIIGKAGFDITLIDLEHGLNNQESLQDLVFTTKKNNTLSIARLPCINYSNISQIIDTGIDGILFPHIEEKSQVEFLKNETLLHPLGSRGFSPFVPKFDYGLNTNIGKKDILIGVLVESIKGVENIKEILESPLVDFVYFGAYDLSVELGKSGEIFDNEVLLNLKKVLKVSNFLKKKTMAIYRNEKELELLKKYNVSFPIASVDTNILLKALTKEINLYKKIINLDCG